MAAPCDAAAVSPMRAWNASVAAAAWPWILAVAAALGHRRESDRRGAARTQIGANHLPPTGCGAHLIRVNLYDCCH